MGVIYKISNTENSKLYIGGTRHLGKRWSAHKFYGRNNFSGALYADMFKLGVDKFHIEILEECPDGKIVDLELYWIQYYDTFLPNGYNKMKPTKPDVGPRKYYPNQCFRVSKYEAKIFVKCHEHGYTTREIIAIMTERSTRHAITIFSKTTEEPIIIPRGFLQRKISPNVIIIN